MKIKDATDNELRLLMAALLYTQQTSTLFVNFCNAHNIPIPFGDAQTTANNLVLLISKVPVPEEDWKKAFE